MADQQEFSFDRIAEDVYEELYDDVDQQYRVETADKLRGTYTGLQVKMGHGAQSRKFSDEQIDEVAKQYDADADSLSLSKRLFDAKHPAVKAVNEALAHASSVFKNPSYTLPFTDKGVRLVRRDKLQEIDKELKAAAEEIAAAARQLRDKLPEIKEQRKKALKKLFNPVDYDFDPTEKIKLTYKFRSLEPPEYLKQNPQIYAQEVSKARAALVAVVQLREEELAQSMFDAIDHLMERLEPQQLLDDNLKVQKVVKDKKSFVVKYSEKGETKEVTLTADEYKRRVTKSEKPKVFQPNTIAKLFDAVDSCQQELKTNGIGQGEMSKVLERLKKTLSNNDPQSLAGSLKASPLYREDFHKRLKTSLGQLEELAVHRPRRVVARKQAKSATVNPELV